MEVDPATLLLLLLELEAVLLEVSVFFDVLSTILLFFDEDSRGEFFMLILTLFLLTVDGEILPSCLLDLRFGDTLLEEDCEAFILVDVVDLCLSVTN